MREAASRGFWMTTYAPYGYKKVHVQDGPKKRPKLELNPPADAVVRRIFDMALQGRSTLDIAKTFNAEGIPTSNGKKWLKTTVHFVLTNEAYVGTVVWGEKAKDGAPPVRVEDAHPCIVSKQEFRRIARMMESRAPKMDIIVDCLCEPQSGIKLAACQESGVRGDGSATKIQADSAVELELQRGVGAFTHWVPPARLRYPELDPASSASLAPTLPITPRYAAQIGSTLTGLRRTHAADLGNVGLIPLVSILGPR